MRRNIFTLIEKNDLSALKSANLTSIPLNFQEDFLKEIDDKVAPIHVAAFFGKLDPIRLLLLNPGIDVDIETVPMRHTALLIACAKGNYEVAEILLEHQAEPNKPNKKNDTPLATVISRLILTPSYSYENKRITFKLAELLLDYGADINWIVNKMKGYTMLMELLAIKEIPKTKESLHTDIIKFLCEHGANKELTSLKGKSSFDLVSKHPLAMILKSILLNVDKIFFHNPVLFRKMQAERRTAMRRNTDHIIKEHRRSRSLYTFMGFCNR